MNTQQLRNSPSYRALELLQNPGEDFLPDLQCDKQTGILSWIIFEGSLKFFK